MTRFHKDMYIRGQWALRAILQTVSYLKFPFDVYRLSSFRPSMSLKTHQFLGLSCQPPLHHPLHRQNVCILKVRSVWVFVHWGRKTFPFSSELNNFKALRQNSRCLKICPLPSFPTSCHHLHSFPCNYSPPQNGPGEQECAQELKLAHKIAFNMPVFKLDCWKCTGIKIPVFFTWNFTREFLKSWQRSQPQTWRSHFLGHSCCFTKLRKSNLQKQRMLLSKCPRYCLQFPPYHFSQKGLFL